MSSGVQNTADGEQSVVSGGGNNRALSTASAISGGNGFETCAGQGYPDTDDGDPGFFPTDGSESG